MHGLANTLLCVLLATSHKEMENSDRLLRDQNSVALVMIVIGAFVVLTWLKARKKRKRRRQEMKLNSGEMPEEQKKENDHG